jgi:glycosyltransferase involved in cell wall biosynthesis
MEKKSKLLFITQKINDQDDDLAFVTQWVDEFIKNGFSVQVVCLELGSFDNHFPVFSLGKEKGYSKLKRTFRFLTFIMSTEYDRVFVHMNPEYFSVGGWWWFLTRKPAYLWYTHYTTHIHLKLAALFSKRMFAATKQSLPQYDGNPKKVILGHGVDVEFWQNENRCVNAKSLLMVHRISRSKRVEIGIETLVYLPSEYTLTIYGRPIDPAYFEELKALIIKLGLENRVTFAGPLPMPELRVIYPQYKIMINMASETIDKTMLEAMCNGVFPVTTSSNAAAIGLLGAPEGDAPHALASFILSGATNVSQHEMVQIVTERHSLGNLVVSMTEYIKKGI